MVKLWRAALLAIVALLSGISLATPSYAWDWAVAANITMVEPTYLPTGLDFWINQAGGTCAAGSNLFWTITGSDEQSKIANATAVYSALLTAMVANRTVMVYGFNSGCTVAFIHIM